MKTKFKTSVILLALIGMLPFSTNAQVVEKKAKFSIEIDPVTFVFKGFSVHLRIQPKYSDHLLLGAGVYAMDMPSVLVDLNKNNKDKGWNVRLNQGYGLFGEYHFTKVNKKWFAGGQTSIQEYIIKNDLVPGSSKFTNVLVMGYAGYTFQPFKFKLYFKPWAGIGYTSLISGDNMIGEATYDISPISMFATLHIGYTF